MIDGAAVSILKNRLLEISALENHEPRIDLGELAKKFGIAQIYIIVTTGRCGSTEIVHTLDQIKCCGSPYEYFANDVIDKRLISVGVSTFRDYIEAVLARASHGGIFGFKTTPKRLFDLNSVIDLKLEEAPERMRWIDLRRHDLVAQAFSMARAVSSGVWHRVEGQPRGRTVADLAGPGTGQCITDRQVIKTMNEILGEETSIDSFYARHALPVLRLHYEELLRSRQAIVERLIRHVGAACRSAATEPIPPSKVERLSGVEEVAAQLQFLERNRDAVAALLDARSVSGDGSGGAGTEGDVDRAASVGALEIQLAGEVGPIRPPAHRQSLSNEGNRMKIATISIERKVANPGRMRFSQLYDAIGKNTGNLLFTEAVYRQIDGEMSQIGFHFDPDEVNRTFDAVVIPAANWLNKNANWDWLCDMLERIQIPVVTIGIGLQADHKNLQDAEVSPSSIRLARILSDKCAYISTRGEFTTRFLQSIGIMNVVTTGCPSLYLSNLINNKCESVERSGIVVQSTRYYYESRFLSAVNINRELFRLIGKIGAEVIFQSEPEEMEYIVYGSSNAPLIREKVKGICDLYGFDGEKKLFEFIDQKGKVFFDIDDWSSYVSSKQFLISTRIHGTIIALNSGVPALLCPHDSRTSELAEFAKIPTLGVGVDLSEIDVTELYRMLEDVSTEEFLSTREENLVIYQQFLKVNGLMPQAMQAL